MGSPCCAVATRVSISGSPTTWSTRSSRSATSSWPAASWPPWSVVEAVVRLLPGVLGNDDSVGDESFSAGLLEYPQYTRPAEFRGWEVPEVLRSGDHGRVDAWRRVQALVRTLARRPDLIADRGGLTDEEVRLLVEHGEVQSLARTRLPLVRLVGAGAPGVSQCRPDRTEVSSGRAPEGAAGGARRGSVRTTVEDVVP